MTFPTSPYTQDFLVAVDRTVTRDRLLRYLSATGGNLPNALILYEYNVALSETMYGALHGFEVALRNAMHHALSQSYGAPDWYDRAPLTEYWRDQVDAAKNKVCTSAGTAAPGKVVAEMTLGFWVELTSRRNNNTLWVRQQLRGAFPHTTLQRADVHDRLTEIKLLRNRISHHERILTARNVLHNGGGGISIREVLECAAWICPHTEQWLRSRFRIMAAEKILERAGGHGIRL